MPERIVSVYRFEQLWREAGEGRPEAPGPRAAFEIDCGSGTYVRSLITGLGDAYCLALRRLAIGPFDVRDAALPPRRGAPWSAPAPLEPERVIALLDTPALPDPAGPRSDSLTAER
jgi:tRNA pseudouridine55 synthase